MSQFSQHYQAVRQLIMANKAIALTALVAVIFLPFSFIYHPTVGSPYTTINILRFIVIAMLFIAICFRQYHTTTLFKYVTTIAAPLMALYFTLLFKYRPLRADTLAMENKAIEDLSFLLLMVAALALIVTAILLLRSRRKLAGCLALLLGLAFFVIGMEEVSWLQYQLKLKPSDFFMQNNYQKELNLHNIDTELSERLYYFGAFLLLTVLPYLRHSLSKLLDYLKQPALKTLLPPIWLAAPFIISAAFMRTSNFYSPTYAAISIGSLCILASFILIAYKDKKYAYTIYLAAIMVLFLYLNNYFITVDFNRLHVRIWVGTEYREFFIAWGLAAYALSVLVNTRQSIRNRVLPKQA